METSTAYFWRRFWQLSCCQRALTLEREVSLIIVTGVDGQPHQEPHARHLNGKTESWCGWRRTSSPKKCSRQKGQMGWRRGNVFSAVSWQQLEHKTCPGWGWEIVSASCDEGEDSPQGWSAGCTADCTLLRTRRKLNQDQASTWGSRRRNPCQVYLLKECLSLLNEVWRLWSNTRPARIIASIGRLRVRVDIDIVYTRARDSRCHWRIVVILTAEVMRVMVAVDSAGVGGGPHCRHS